MTRSRDVHAILRPRTVDDVRGVVSAFAAAPDGPALHAVSTGRNWGLGSAEPANDGVVTMELAGLDRIRDVDIDGGWAVVEPGVTQHRLARQLADTSRFLNLTASSAHTSVLGNIIDRGVGLRRQRVDDLAGLEIVLPDGRLVRVGWWPGTDRRTAVNPLGLGPSLLHLFTQSDLGIATAAVVRLLPRPDAQRIVHLEFEPERLAGAVDLLRRWMVNGLTSGVIKVYDTVSAQSYGGADGSLGAHLCVDGTEMTVTALTDAIVDEAMSSGLFQQVRHSGELDPAPEDSVTQVIHRGHAARVPQLRAVLGHDR